MKKLSPEQITELQLERIKIMVAHPTGLLAMTHQDKHRLHEIEHILEAQRKLK